jgi:hypothetical protein
MKSLSLQSIMVTMGPSNYKVYKERPSLKKCVGIEWAAVGGLNQLESTTKLPVVLTRGSSTQMVILTIVDFNLFQLENG